MTTDDNVSLAEAAKAVGLHFNTIRNWRKQGRLTSAQKVIERGVEVWIVSLSEVQRVATDTNNMRPSQGHNTPQQPLITDSPANGQQPMTTSLQTVQAQNMALIVSEAVGRSVKPLAELIDKQSAELQKLNRENGELSTELRLLKERLEALETARRAQEAAKTPQPMTTPDITLKPVDPPQPAQEPPKRGRLARFFGIK